MHLLKHILGLLFLLPTLLARTISIIDYLSTNPALSSLHPAMSQPVGFPEAFSQIPPNNFTFFAPNNPAFAHLSKNLKRHYTSSSRSGRAKLGNMLMHHYVPVDAYRRDSGVLCTDPFSRIHSGIFLFMGVKKVDGVCVINRRVKVVEGNIPVTGGLLHIVDGVLDPAGMFFDDEYVAPKIKQGYMAGRKLSY
ncbi:hypothetical protein L873DRAFT_1788910 [Choiromyces venosus 120613-1]|uniref:FAS1 domain-containing protein n=1 Tax=Choiromyces venosus 120613-1 TaxID=1336337 RepID=A0A3N4JQG8_9PEZI|nr:hypothetical protein L873DRAFT_1788910 [Choiromyces venosus 120613-1]